jgi:hypothetical protein
MIFIVREEHPHDFLKMLRVLFRESMLEKVFDTAANVRRDESFGKRTQVEARARVIDSICQVLRGIRERAVQIKHHELNGFLHQRTTLARKISAITKAVNYFATSRLCFTAEQFIKDFQSFDDTLLHPVRARLESF